MLSMQFLRNNLEPLLPSFFFDRTFFQLELWQWAFLLAIAVVAYFLSYTAAKISVFAARRVLVKHIRSFDRQTLRLTFKPLRLVYLVIIVAIVIPFLDLARTPSVVVVTVLKILAIISLTWLSFRIFDVVMVWLSERVIEKGRASILSTLPLLRRTGKVVISILAGLVVLQNLHIEVTALLAGLGVGGIAVALASKNTLENLLGGVMIILDQPLRVGEECKIGTHQGVVEDIGLRSTRIRTLERSVVAVPNSELSQMQIENLTHRDRIRMSTSFGLRYETTPEQLRSVLINIRQILYAHPKIDRDPARVRFVNFGSQSLDVEIVAYVLTSSASEHLAVKEDILLRIMDVIHESGTAFALPSQITYQSPHDFLDGTLKIQAEKHVTDLRNSQQLPLPEFSDEQISNIDDTIDYPPRGSANKDPKGRYS